MPSVVMSGAYVGNELKKEFGRIPPALLPAGGRPLLGLIATELIVRDPRFLVLPDSYKPTAGEVAEIELAGFNSILLSPKLTVEDAIAALPPDAINGELDLFFGDTFVAGLDLSLLPPDSYVIADAPSHYEWAFLSSENPCQFKTMAAEDRDQNALGQIACGIFRFSDGYRFQQCVIQSGDLADALTNYASTNPVELVSTSEWVDFGHYDTYFAARRDLLIARAHNALTVERSVLEKCSNDVAKVTAECQWYESLPRTLWDLIPRYYGPVGSIPGTACYQLEYLPIPVLSELWVYGRGNHQHWRSAFRESLAALDRIHAVDVSAKEAPEPVVMHHQLWESKLRNRIATLANSGSWIDSVIGLSDELSSIGEGLLGNFAMTKPSDIGFVHGDFFFGNLLFETRSNRVFMIDPRGMIGSQITSIGDQRYDVAKLAMSIWFGYDQIIEGRYQFGDGPIGRRPLERDHSEYESATTELFMHYLETSGYSVDDIVRAAAILVLSLLPFHAEDPLRQEALICCTLDQLRKRSLR